MAKTKRAAALKYEPDYEIDMDEVEEDQQEAELSGEYNIPWWKPVEGKNRIRVLPPLPGEKVPYHKVFLHYGLGPIPLTCPGKKTCPICDYISNRGGRDHPLSGTRRIFFNILDREDEDAGVQVYSSGNTFLKEFLAHLRDPDWGDDVVHPIDGFDVTIERTGTGLNTEYPSIRFRRNPSPIAGTQEELDELLDSRIDLAAISPETNPDRLEELLDAWIDKKGRKEARDEDDDTRDKPRKRPKKSKTEKEPEEEDEDEDEDNDGDEDEDEDEVEDKPKKKKRTPASRTPKKKKLVESEDEDEDEDEDESESEEGSIEDLLARLGKAGK